TRLARRAPAPRFAWLMSLASLAPTQARRRAARARWCDRGARAPRPDGARRAPCRYGAGMSAFPRPTAASLPAAIKPKLRGVSHQYAFFVSLACGAGLILTATSGRARLAAGIYAAAVSALLGTSALYHRVTWRPPVRRWMRRLDHSMIFVLIAGTYTPVALLALKGQLANAILIVVWVGALGGALSKLVWIDAPKWVFAVVYVAFG